LEGHPKDSGISRAAASNELVGLVGRKRVKFSLLGFHLRHKLLNPTDGKLVSNQETYPLVMLDLTVEFRTLFTHAKFRIRAWQTHSCRIFREQSLR